MRARVRCHRLQKAGNAPEEYEDALWPSHDVERVTSRLRCAVADGATETSFSGLWAGMLVGAYGRGRLSTRAWNHWLPALQSSWHQQVTVRPLPWYAEAKVVDGAFSALLGLTVAERARGVRWTALAVGDSCLFQVRDRHLLTSFPIARADAFTSRPRLLGTRPGRSGDLEELAVRRSGECLPGDTFYLLTDALACWFLTAVESDREPWRELDEVGAGACPFDGWVAHLRRSGNLRNDDVTAVRVSLD